jgi:hypothetical protein
MHVEHRDEDGKFEIWVTYPWRTECWCAAGWLVSLPPWIAFSVLKKIIQMIETSKLKYFEIKSL